MAEPVTTPSRRYVMTALVAGAATAVAVALWALEIITLPVFVGLLVLVGVVELAVLLPAIGRRTAGEGRGRGAGGG